MEKYLVKFLLQKKCIGCFSETSFEKCLDSRNILMEGFRVKDRNGYPFFSYQTEMWMLEIDFTIL